MSDYITGKLILAGYYSPNPPLARVVVVMSPEKLAAVKFLPMHEEVAVVPVAEAAGGDWRKEADLRAEIERWRDSNRRLREEMEHQSRRADEANAECVRLQMELDASCNSEELRQVRADLAAAREELAAIEGSNLKVSSLHEERAAKAEAALTAAQTELKLLRVALDAAETGCVKLVEVSDDLAAAREVFTDRLHGLADRWDRTEEWHNPPFYDGRIEISTRELHDIAALRAAIDAAKETKT